MPERPRPNLDRVRDAMRDADEREETAPSEPEPEETPTEDDEDTGT